MCSFSEQMPRAQRRHRDTNCAVRVVDHSKWSILYSDKRTEPDNPSVTNGLSGLLSLLPSSGALSPATASLGTPT